MTLLRVWKDIGIPDLWSICFHDPGYMVIGYMVIPDTWSILAGPNADQVSGTHCIRNRVYIIIAFQLVNPINMDSDMVLLPLPLSF